MLDRVVPWLFRTLVRWVGAYTLLAMTLLLVAMGSLAWTLSEVIYGLGLDLLLPVALVGLLLGWSLAAARPVPGWLAGILISLLGLELVLLRVGRLDQAVIRAGHNLLILFWQTARWPVADSPDPGPLLLAVAELGTGLSTLLVRFSGWLLALVAGQPSLDLVAASLTWSLAVGAVAAWAAWGVRRLEHPLLAMVPAGALLATTLAYALRYQAGLLPLVGATVLLMGLVSHRAREQRWQARGVDFAASVRLELGAAIVYISVAVLVLAGSVPSLSVNSLVRLVQRVFQVETTLDSLGVRRPPPASSSLADEIRAPGLPRGHLLGSGPELSEQVVLVIKTDDPPPAPDRPGPRLYWRSHTYDNYTGRGWRTSRTEVRSYPAGEPLLADTLPGHRLLHQEIQVVADQRTLLYAAGTPVTVDQGVEANWRAPDDFFGATIAATRYQVDSLVPAVTAAELRQAQGDYPPWLAQRYLRLPPDLPQRVISLARDLTATAPTAYDRAKAIETALRQFPYTLDLPEPPGQRDMVDYFLFDLQQGYCDYYATSMVVLARAAGLPARLAVGYISDRYDPVAGRYIVTEAEAHSWVEIYFPGYGWINFEPTGGRPALERADGEADASALDQSLLPPPAPNKPVGLPPWWPALPLLTGLLLPPLVVLVWLVVDGWWLRAATPAVAVTHLYRRFRRYGPRLDTPGLAGDTPFEFTAAVAARLADLAQAKRLGPLLAPAPGEVRQLTGLYVQTLYSPHPPDVAAQHQAIRIWRRLQLRLWIAWLRFKLKR